MGGKGRVGEGREGKKKGRGGGRGGEGKRERETCSKVLGGIDASGHNHNLHRLAACTNVSTQTV